MKQFYVTTPIYYVNDVPHIGHAYTTLAADILARYWQDQLGKENVFFLTGTDEHGQKVAESAEKEGVTPKEFADRVSPRFEEAWNTLNIKPDYFIRTTDPKHEKVASDLLQKIYDKGFIYEGEYEGLYCVGGERYLTESELVDGKCPLHPNQKPILQKEKNYFLKLTELAKIVHEKIKIGEYKVEPETRKREVLSRLEQGVEDISISREGVSWGIPVPWDNSQTIYVWVEALMNYYSATKFVEGKEKFWPADLHLVGKDILWFHSVIWQALLIAAEVELPKTIFAHGFFTIDGQKMSKSLGNVISPKDMVDRYGVDGARYLLIGSYAFGSDGDISYDKFDTKFNADLANGLGNLVARVAKMAEKNNLDASQLKYERKDKLIDKTAIFVENFQFDKALELIITSVSSLDKYLDKERPWELSPDEANKKLGNIIVGSKAVTSLLEIAEALKPFMPETSERIQKQFSGKVTSGDPLFPRIDTK